MRIKELKIEGVKKEAVLVAGGSGFKIYTTSGLDGWVITLGRKVFVVPDNSPDFITVGRYVNLNFQPMAEQPKIKDRFDAFIQSKTEVRPEPPLDSAP